MKFLRYKCEAKAVSINLVIKHITSKGLYRDQEVKVERK